MTQKETIAAVAAAGALGIGAWWFLFREGDKDNGDTSLDDEVYGVDRSTRVVGGDTGGAVSGEGQDDRGQDVPPGAQHYRFKNKVTAANVPPYFGVRSYRRTMCTATRGMVVDDGNENAWRVYGRARRCFAGGLNYAWNDAAFQTGVGFANNGAALVARSWSCSPSFAAGPLNVNCTNAKGYRRDLMGFVPLRKEYWATWAGGGADAVPFIEWNAPNNAGEQPDATHYLGMTDRQRGTLMGGFITERGRLWVEGSWSRNFGMIADEDKSVRYFYAMIGENGARSAARVMPGGVMRFIPESQIKPIWVGNQSQANPALTRHEFRSFMANEEDRKNDPWQIPDSPWEVMDLAAKEWTGTYGGKTYTIDYRLMRGGNPQFKRLIAQAKEFKSGSYTGGSGRVILNCRNVHLRPSDMNWPVVNYGLINPFRGNPSDPNAMPVDFAAPVFINRFFGMDYFDPGFTG